MTAVGFALAAIELATGLTWLREARRHHSKSA